MRVIGRTFTAGALLAVSQVALAEGAPDAQGLLERMNEAARSVSYEGTFIYRHDGDLETLRVLRQAGEGGVRERLYSLTGLAREIVRDNDKVTWVLPDDRAVMVDRRQLENPFEGVLPADVDALAALYDLSVEGEARVAGRPAVEVAIRPRDNYRYGYNVWVDEASGLLLRSDLVNEQGEIVEQIMFTELETPAQIGSQDLEPKVRGEGYTWYRYKGEATPTASSAVQGWEVLDLPAGFRLALHEVRQLPGSEVPVEHMLYSDGLSSVSVYIEPMPVETSFSGDSSVGAMHAHGRHIDDHQITVVGEVPAATVEKIADSVRKLANGGS